MKAIRVEVESSESDIDFCGWDSDSDRRNGYMATGTDRAQEPDRHNIFMDTAADRAQNPGYPLI